MERAAILGVGDGGVRPGRHARCDAGPRGWVSCGDDLARPNAIHRRRHSPPAACSCRRGRGRRCSTACARGSRRSAREAWRDRFARGLVLDAAGGALDERRAVPARGGGPLLPRGPGRTGDPVRGGHRACRRAPGGRRQAAFPAGGAGGAVRARDVAGAAGAAAGQSRTWCRCTASIATPRGWCCSRPTRPRARRTRTCSGCDASTSATRRWRRHCRGWRSSRDSAAAAFADRAGRTVLPHARGHRRRGRRGQQRDPHRGDRTRRHRLALRAAAGHRTQAPAARAHGRPGCADRTTIRSIRCWRCRRQTTTRGR